jgi:hypothetical protein
MLVIKRSSSRERQKVFGNGRYVCVEDRLQGEFNEGRICLLRVRQDFNICGGYFPRLGHANPDLHRARASIAMLAIVFVPELLDWTNHLARVFASRRHFGIDGGVGAIRDSALDAAGSGEGGEGICLRFACGLLDRRIRCPCGNGRVQLAGAGG